MHTLGDTRDMETLPFIDEHTVVAGASPEAVWDTLHATFDRPLTGIARRYAQLVGVNIGAVAASLYV